MKYMIETTAKGCIEKLEVGGDIFKKESVRTDFGCKSLDEDFADQLERCGYDEGVLEKVYDLYDGFGALEFLEMADELE